MRVIDAGRVGGGSSHGNCGTITPSHAPPLAAPGMVLQGAALDADARTRRCTSPPRFDPRLWSWLLRFAVRCNERDWRAARAAKSAILNDSRARLADWVARLRRWPASSPTSGEDYVFRDPRDVRALRATKSACCASSASRVEVVDGRALRSDRSRR